MLPPAAEIIFCEPSVALWLQMVFTDCNIPVAHSTHPFRTATAYGSGWKLVIRMASVAGIAAALSR